MPTKEATYIYHCNQYNAAAACEHCDGVIRHEAWCITRDPIVYYAYEAVVHPEKLTVEDAIHLHALGVTWNRPACPGACNL